MKRHLVLIVFVSALLGCTYFPIPVLTRPAGLTATQGEELDRIVLSWIPVEDAAIYYVYRQGED